MTERTQYKLGTLMAALFESKLAWDYGFSDETKLDRITTKHLSTLCRELAEEIPSIYNHVSDMIWHFLEDVMDNSDEDENVFRFAIIEGNEIVGFYYGQFAGYNQATGTALFKDVFDENGEYVNETVEWSLEFCMQNSTCDFSTLISRVPENIMYWECHRRFYGTEPDEDCDW